MRLAPKMQCAPRTPAADRKQNTMMTNRRNMAWTILLAANSLYWAAFWGYFFLLSVATQPRVAWEQPPLIYTVLGRSFPMTAPDVYHTFMLQSAFWVQLPCWLLTWPLGKLMGTA